MTVGAWLLRRAAFALLLVFLVSSAALVLTKLAPGDFVATDAAIMDPAARERLRGELGLDRPLTTQYLEWLGGVAHLDFGESLLYRRPVRALLGERLLNTAVLAAAALLVATLLGLPLGLYTGATRGWLPSLVSGLSLLVLSVPPLVAALGLSVVAARTGWAPVGGMTSATLAEASWAAWTADVLRHLPLPVLALALPFAASLERLQSQALNDAAAEPFVDAAMARGLSRDEAIRKHAWRVSLRPVLGVYGVMVGALFSGSFIVEVVTSWPGLGRLMFDALRARDLYLVAGTAAAGALCLAVGTFLADVLMAAADPRIGEEADE
ncbi:MAG: ABC transporter permease [Vicinamibacterales bacterium]